MEHRRSASRWVSIILASMGLGKGSLVPPSDKVRALVDRALVCQGVGCKMPRHTGR